MANGSRSGTDLTVHGKAVVAIGDLNPRTLALETSSLATGLSGLLNESILYLHAP